MFCCFIIPIAYSLYPEMSTVSAARRLNAKMDLTTSATMLRGKSYLLGSGVGVLLGSSCDPESKATTAAATEQ